MIDIIIPCYNSHEYLPRCLGSILMQTEKDYSVCLVNDGGDNYDEIIKDFSKYMKIWELNYHVNRGSGFARKNGFIHTESPLVMWIDSDDCLANPYALKSLKDGLLSDTRNVLCAANFQEESPNGDEFIEHFNDMIWMHGKMYKRQFLLNHDIYMNNTRSNEDAGFNMLCKLCLGENELINYLDRNVYFWMYNSESIVRKDVNDYRDNISFTAYVDNMLWAFSEVEKRNIHTKEILHEKVMVLFKLAILLKQANARSPQYADNNWNNCKRYYEEFRKIENKITPEILITTYKELPLDCRKYLSLEEFNNFYNALNN